MRRSNLIIALCVVGGAAVGGVIGFLLNDPRTGISVGCLGGLAVGFGITGLTATPVQGPARPGRDVRG